MVDDYLNDVRLYLPYFNEENVRKVIQELQDTEGGEIPTVIDSESLENPTYVTWTARGGEQGGILQQRIGRGDPRREQRGERLGSAQQGLSLIHI